MRRAWGRKKERVAERRGAGAEQEKEGEASEGASEGARDYVESDSRPGQGWGERGGGGGGAPRAGGGGGEGHVR